jgi:hypothetical protein
MPHDAKGRELKVGDKVLVPAVVTSIAAGEDYCNLTVQTERPMKPSDQPTMITFNASQVDKVEE